MSGQLSAQMTPITRTLPSASGIMSKAPGTCSRRAMARATSISGRDDDVDRHVLAGEQVGPDRRQIALIAHAGDLDRDVEQRVGHLAGHHIDLVGLRDRDDHVGLGDAAAPARRGEKRTDHRLDVQVVADLLDQFAATGR